MCVGVNVKQYVVLATHGDICGTQIFFGTLSKIGKGWGMERTSTRFDMSCVLFNSLFNAVGKPCKPKNKLGCILPETNWDRKPPALYIYIHICSYIYIQLLIKKTMYIYIYMVQ